jgi:cysteine desulfurase/selenocysteine lyase
MPLDVARLRADTPGVTDHIHLNNAGAALPPRQVLDRQIEHLHLEARVGGYRAARLVADELRGVRRSVASLIGAEAHEVALHQSATTAWTTAVLAFVQTAKVGDCVVLDHAVYGAHAIAWLQLARRFGLTLSVVRNDARGQLDVSHLESILAAGPVALVCLTHIPTSSGLVNPVEAAGALCGAAGVPMVLDACQSVGQWPVDVEAIGCAALAATGRKFLRGPRGTGFLYVRRSAWERFPPLAPDLRAAEWTASHDYTLAPDARRYETWERAVAADLGLGVAVELALGLGISAIRARVTGLADRLRNGLAGVDGVTGQDTGVDRCGICTFDVEGHSASRVAEWLQQRRITVSVTHATSAQLDLGVRGLDSVVRASVHVYNTEAEVDALVEALGRLVSEADGGEQPRAGDPSG